MKTHQFAEMIFCLFLSVVMVSCTNKNLSLGKAKDMIATRDKLPAAETVDLPKQYVKQAACIVVNSHFYSGEDKQWLDRLQQQGLITLTEVNQNNGNCQMVLETVVLTETGRKYLVGEEGANPDRFFGEKSAHYLMKTNDLTISGVTGIQVFEQLKHAEAKYTLVRTNFTPFGTSVNRQPETRTAGFSLFDDGWHIEPNNNN